MTHYHIRWSNARLDWEVFRTEYEAKAQAEELVQPDETYTVEQFNGDCPRCVNFRNLGSPRE